MQRRILPDTCGLQCVVQGETKPVGSRDCIKPWRPAGGCDMLVDECDLLNKVEMSSRA
jgi:hypothetical protein